MRRRTFIGTLLLTCASLPQKLFAGVTSAGSNFKRIYSSIALKNEFFKFLKNVFNLMPENDLHRLISEATARKDDDRDVLATNYTNLHEEKPAMAFG